jgi:UrcA family protein
MNVTNTRSMLARFVIVTGFCALSFAASAVQPLADQSTVPASGDKRVTYPVHYADLDVSTLKGVKSLYSRIRYAALLVCRKDVTWSRKDGDVCLQSAIGTAVAAVNAPLLTQYAELRSERNKSTTAPLAKAN